MVFRLCLLLSVAISTSVFAAKTTKPAAKTAEECAEDEAQKLAGAVMGAVSKIGACGNHKNIQGLCNVIAGKSLDKTPGTTLRYEYQRIIINASCVDQTKDSPEIIQQKIQAMWSSQEEKLVCNNVMFEVKNGSVLKFAAAIGTYDFLDDAIRKWKVNLNRVDPVDNRTLLDYIEVLQARHKGNPEEARLNAYHKRLVTAGAKRKAEL